MWKKLASMIAGSILVSSCQTAMYKPIICEPGTALKDGRCQKVAPIEKRTVLDVPKKKKFSKTPVFEEPRPEPIQEPRRVNEYGQPI